MNSNVLQLGELITIEKGKKPSQLLERQTATSRRYIQIDDLRPDAKHKYVEPFACPIASPTDVIIAWDGANAGTVSCNLHGYIGSTLAILRPKTDRLFAPYLSWFLERKFDYLQANSTGATIPHLSRDVLDGIQVPLPTIHEQQQISGRLEDADRLRRTRRYALEISDSFLSSVFLELFCQIGSGFPPLSVDELALNRPHAIRTGPFGSQLLHSEFTDKGIAVLGIDNAVNNEFAWGQRRFITQEKYERLKRYTVLPGDVIITIMGTCGRCAIVPNDIPTAINTKHLCCITLDQDRCLPIYLHAAFLFHPFVRRQLGVATKGAIMDGLNMEIIKGLRIPLPPLSLQKKFSTLVKQVEHLRALQREALRQAEHLYYSLLNQYFSD